MEGIKIVSLNVRDLANKEKRCSIFNFYRNRADILCLQETHCVNEQEKIWLHEWGGKGIFSNDTGAARSVCILIHRNSNIHISNVRKDTDGRMLLCQLERDKISLEICNIYATNNDAPEFFSHLYNMCQERFDKLIIIGHFNLVMDTSIDRKGSEVNNKKALEVLENLAEEFLLQDIWRIRNPSLKRYSWYRLHKTKGMIASRIDFALMSQSLCSQTLEAMYMTGLHTDHSAMYIYLEPIASQRGSGFWKFNTSLLSDLEYLKFMNAFLDDFKSMCDGLEIKRKWELLKFEIARMTKEFAKQRTCDRELLIAQLSENIVKIEDNLDKKNDRQTLNILENSKIELDQLMKEKTKGTIFRSKARWQDLGEKSSKYFFALEKSKYNSKTCNVLIDDDNNFVTDPGKILEMQRRFYQKLYSRDSKVNFTIENTENISISPKQNSAVDEKISFEEFAIALKQMKNSKCPGPDGIPCDFWKTFFAKIGQEMYNAIINAIDENEMWDLALRGIINLIPKAKKDIRYLQNLRPITLLNSDYKVIEKIIANRIKPVLDDIISSDQKGFLKDRKIAANIRKVYDLMNNMEAEGKEALIFSINFRKCFDMIEFDVIYKSLDFFGFGEKIINLIKLLYTGFTVSVQNNGNFLNEIRIECSVHQGGPNSMYLFLLCAEVLAIELRKNPDISGLFVKQIEYLLSQYADDMDMFTINDKNMIKRIIDVFERFRQNSGFTINYDKTQLYRIGSLEHTKSDEYVKIAENIDIKITNKPINVLGVWIAHELKDIYSLNYDSIVQQVHDILNSWQHRGLSIIGKISVINTLCASLFVYKMQVLTSIKDDIVSKLHKEFSDFIWGGGVPKISLKMLQGNKADGGLGLVNLHIKDASLKIGWISYLFTDPELMNLAYTCINCSLKENIWLCNLKVNDIKTVLTPRGKDSFWIDVLRSWATLNYQPQIKQEKGQFIWLNSLI